MASQASSSDIAMERGKAYEESPSIQEVSDNQPKRNETNNSKDEIRITILEKKEQIELLHRLPSMLERMDLERKNFEPMVVSLGPYHHGKEHLQITLDDKHRARDQLLQGKIAENFYKEETRFSMEAARKLYVDDPEFSLFSTDDLILDACFIIHVMDYIVDEKTSGLAIRPHLLPLVVEDMFLLENQVPFRALECAMKCLGMKAKVMITEFVTIINESPIAPSARNCLQYWEEPCECICQLVIIAVVALSLGHLRQRLVHHNKFERFWKEGKPFHLLQILRAHLLGYSEEEGPEPQPYLRPRPLCATELKTAGIGLERRWTYSLEDARFEKGIIRRLCLPSITQLTIPRLMNLIAYELCPSGAGYGITSYVHFLNGLIDRPEDVKELRSTNILSKDLGSDEYLATFFKQLVANLAPDPFAYYNALKDTETHFRSKWRSAIASFCYKHFNSPWTTISSLIAVLLFLLTIAQAYTSFFDGKK